VSKKVISDTFLLAAISRTIGINTLAIHVAYTSFQAARWDFHRANGG